MCDGEATLKFEVIEIVGVVVIEVRVVDLVGIVERIVGGWEWVEVGDNWDSRWDPGERRGKEVGGGL